MSFYDAIRVGASGAADYEVDRSLRFNRSDSAHLTYTPASASSDRTKVTISAWVKKCGINEGEYMIAHAGTTNNNRAQLRFYTSSGFDNISFAARVSGSWILQLDTTAKFRDPSAWYHIVARCDTTNGTANLYINGVEETDLATSTKPSGSQSMEFFNNSEHQIGERGYAPSNTYMNGYMAEINVIQGQALDASYFGETDAITGQWNPKKYVGGYGDGFYLNFSDNSGTTATTLGKDSSGNGNNFTPNNFSVSSGSGNDSLIDTPTNNFCTLNPLDKHANVSTVQGNLETNSTTSGSHFPIFSTMSMKGGKYYMEYKCKNADNGWNVQIMNIEHDGGSLAADSTVGNNASAVNKVGYGLLVGSGRIRHNTFLSSPGAYGSALAVNGAETGMCAVDLDNGKIYWGKEGTFFDSGDPANGTNAAFTGIDTDITWNFCFHVLNNNNVELNFGQHGFEFTPPTGFKALNSQNLSDPTILLPNKHFDTFLYTATGNAMSFSGLNFQPDWIWQKNRNTSSSHFHYLFDSVRGGRLGLQTNTTGAEFTGPDPNITFTSNGYDMAASSGGQGNASGANYVSWNWNGGGSTVTNNDGSISSQVRANTTAGFSIVGYTGINGAGTIGHGLGVAPRAVIIRRRDSASDWAVFHAEVGNTKRLVLNSTAAESSANSSFFNNTSPTSTTISLGSDAGTGGSTDNYIVYAFSEVAGYSKFGSYTGNNANDGTFVFTGFSVAWLMVKRTDSTRDWLIYDSTRSTFNVIDDFLEPNQSTAEQTASANSVDFVSNGFKFRNNSGDMNGSGTYIYFAFAESPFKNARAR